VWVRAGGEGREAAAAGAYGEAAMEEGAGRGRCCGTAEAEEVRIGRGAKRDDPGGAEGGGEEEAAGEGDERKGKDC
jgi:hypothetical protein